MGIRSLEVSVEVDKSLQGNVSGLLGNFNGDPSDDFLLPDGTVLDQNLTERQIFENFGKKWEVNAGNTIFVYKEGEGAADYSHPEFIPLFKDEFDEESLLAAKAQCGDNDACIFDFLATGDAAFAENTKSTGEESRAIRQSLTNSLPRLNITNGLNTNGLWEVTAWQPAYITVDAEDADNDPVTYTIVGTSAGVRIINNGTIIYVPDPSNPVVIEVQVNDTKGGYSNILNVPVAVCTNCSGHGVCDKDQVRDTDEESSFVVYGCQCLPAYTGDDCELEYDACSDSPCAEGQNCTDLSATEQRNSSVGHKCGPCPVGFQEREANDTLRFCEDINECNNTAICEQNCTNTEGSYFCHCMAGFRLFTTDSKSCRDIDECEEGTHNCDQRCVNVIGGFRCECFPGHKPVNGACQPDETDAEKCFSVNCSQLCNVQNGVPTCLCRSGYILSENNRTCININECLLDRKPCRDICTDTIGGFNCSCFAGFKLAEDRISCTACERSLWGYECMNRCQCNGRGRCDPVRGCICQAGWSGAECNRDIDECATNTHNCTVGQVCVNTVGGFSCRCPPGYRMNTTCIDINECADISTHNCSESLEDCLNNIGSYTCTCKRGYARGANGTCHDINECVTGTHNCQQECVNVNGGFNCRCYPGYEISDDRTHCVKVRDLCEGVNCSHGCKLENNTTRCFCDAGYELGNDSLKCQDIDECAKNSHQCSSNSECDNLEPGYKCKCAAGYRLDNDERTCLSCSSGTWGLNCNMSCACSTGASSCDPVSGCVCLPGYDGTLCESNINQCLDISCNDMTEECIDRPGVDVCQCKPGYNTTSSNSLQCLDIDECSDPSLNNCTQNCINVEGGFNCSCFNGHKYNPSLDTCEVCDPGFWGNNCANQCECSDNTTERCDNVNGYCRCEAGWEGASCTQDKNECLDPATCSQFENTECVNLVGGHRCVCRPGYYDDGSHADQPQCLDIDECLDPILNNCTQNCTNVEGGFNCSCFDGYKYNPSLDTCEAEPTVTTSAQPSTASAGPTVTTSAQPSTASAEPTVTTSAQPSTTTSAGTTVTTSAQSFTTTSDQPSATISAGPSTTTSAGPPITTASLGPTVSEGTSKTTSATTSDPPSNTTQDIPATTSTPVPTICSHGNCSCEPGWEGANCTQDKDECKDTATCSKLENTDCVNLPGSYRCQCRPGYYNNSSLADQPQCIASVIRTAAITFDYNATDEQLNPATEAHEALKIETEKSLHEILQDNLNVLKVNVSDLRTGNSSTAVRTLLSLTSLLSSKLVTLNITFSLEIKSNPDVVNIMASVLFIILRSPLTINSTQYVIKSMFIGGKEFNANSTACDFREGIEPCQEGEKCESQGLLPECTSIDKESTDETDLIIGLAVGIPLFVLLTAAVVFLTCRWLRGRNKKWVKRSLQSDDDESQFHGVFAKGLAKRGTWSTIDRPEDLNQPSTSKGGFKPFGDTYRDSSWFDSRQERRKEGQEQGNFSWDFLYKVLDPEGEEFKIQRPKISIGYTSHI